VLPKKKKKKEADKTYVASLCLTANFLAETL
jgi:hypothetical protein